MLKRTLSSIFEDPFLYHFQAIGRDVGPDTVASDRAFALRNIGVLETALAELRGLMESRNLRRAYPDVERLSQRMEKPIARLRAYFRQENSDADAAEAFYNVLEFRLAELKNMLKSIDAEHPAP